MTPVLTIDRVRAEIAELAGVSTAEVTDEANLMDLGLDSLRAMSLAERWMKAGVPVEFSELAEGASLRHWWTVLVRLSGGL